MEGGRKGGRGGGKERRREIKEGQKREGEMHSRRNQNGVERKRERQDGGIEGEKGKKREQGRRQLWGER